MFPKFHPHTDAVLSESSSHFANPWKAGLAGPGCKRIKEIDQKRVILLREL
jgi:hypothetical protein